MIKKSIYLYFLVTISGIISAFFVSAFVAERMFFKLVDEWQTIAIYEHSFESESAARAAYQYSLLIEGDDYEDMINLSCIRLHVSLEFFDASVYDEFPERQRELEEFIEKAELRELELREQGYCEGW